MHEKYLVDHWGESFPWGTPVQDFFCVLNSLNYPHHHQDAPFLSDLFCCLFILPTDKREQQHVKLKPASLITTDPATLALKWRLQVSLVLVFWFCGGLCAWFLFTKPDQADWLYLDYMQWSERADFTQRCCDSWLMSGLSLQIIQLVTFRKLNDRPVHCLCPLCVCFCLFVQIIWNCVTRPSTAAISAAARLTATPRQIE